MPPEKAPELNKPAPALTSQAEKPTAAQLYANDPTLRAANEEIGRNIDQGHSAQMEIAKQMADKNAQRDTLAAAITAAENTNFPKANDPWWDAPPGVAESMLAMMVTPARIKPEILAKEDQLKKAGLLKGPNIDILTAVFVILGKDYLGRKGHTQETAKTDLLPKFTTFLEQFESIVNNKDNHFGNLEEALIAFSEFTKTNFIGKNGIFNANELTTVLKYDDTTLTNMTHGFGDWVELKNRHQLVSAQIMNGEAPKQNPPSSPPTAEQPPAQVAPPILPPTPPATPDAKPETQTATPPAAPKPSDASAPFDVAANLGKGLIIMGKTVEFDANTTIEQQLEKIKTQLTQTPTINPALSPDKKQKTMDHLLAKAKEFIEKNNIKPPDGITLNADGTLAIYKKTEIDAQAKAQLEQAQKGTEADQEDFPSWQEIMTALSSGAGLAAIMPKIMAGLSKILSKILGTNIDLGGKKKDSLPPKILEIIKKWSNFQESEKQDANNFFAALEKIPALKTMPDERMQLLFSDRDRALKVLAAVKPTTIGSMDLNKFLTDAEIALLNDKNKQLTAAELVQIFTTPKTAAPTPPATPPTPNA